MLGTDTLGYFTFPGLSHKRIFIALLYLSPSLFFLAALNSMRDLNSLARDQTTPLAVEVRSLNHWTTREFLYISFLTKYILLC